MKNKYAKYVIETNKSGYVFVDGPRAAVAVKAQEIANAEKQYVDWGLLGSKQRNYRRTRTFPEAAK